MGMVRMGPPQALLLLLQGQYQISRFVETGTYRGQTAAWAASHFGHVTTIEYARILYDQAVAQHGHLHNIDFVFGDSRTVLKEMVPSLVEPAVFWLDGHWSGGATYGQDDQCPLIEEIEAINQSGLDHFIFIDDARLFTSPPPLPNRIGDWPSINEVFQALQNGRNRYAILIFEDVIMAVPAYAQAVVAGYCQAATTQAWRESQAKKGYRLILEGTRLIGRWALSWLKR